MTTLIIVCAVLMLALGILMHRYSVAQWETWGAIAVFGGALLLTWFAIYVSESLSTEALLVGYYCCVQEGDLPALGTLARSVSDFFRGPGEHVVSMVFLTISFCFFVVYAQLFKPLWRVLLFFIMVNAGYLLLSLLAAPIGHLLGGWLAGPAATPYRGYDYTIYGIVLHALVMAAYIALLLWAPHMNSTHPTLQFDMRRKDTPTERPSQEQLILQHE